MRGPRIMLKAGVLSLASLAALVAMLAISVSPAAAANGEVQFCWEATVGPNSSCEQQVASSYSSVTVKAWSESTGFCVWRTTVGVGESACGEGGHWVTLEVKPVGGEASRFAWPHIQNLNKSKSTRVKGILVYELTSGGGGGGGGGGGETPPPPPPPPGVTTEGPGGSGSGEAILAGSVNPNGSATSYHFEWGLTSAYGNSTSTVSAGSGSSSEAVQSTIYGLAPNTTYHYRLVASNPSGTSQGADHTVNTETAVATVDSSAGNNITEWTWSMSSGWKPTTLFGDKVAAGTKPAVAVVNGVPNIFFVDATDNDTITDWTWNENIGWYQVPFYGHKVAAGTSPSAVVVNGTPHVFYVDETDNDSITDWSWTSTTGWYQVPFYGDKVAAGSSPSATFAKGMPHVFYVDETDKDAITDWSWTSTTGWYQVPFYGHPVAAGSSPAAF
ncbi:MAG TPA: hypothetical protein VGI17_13140 [Solirubrobacterales bacterium]